LEWDKINYTKLTSQGIEFRDEKWETILHLAAKHGKLNTRIREGIIVEETLDI
jgi:hypothetical protein